KQIKDSAKWNMPRVEREALRREALILSTDRTPVDIILRRTRALLDDIVRMPKSPDLSSERSALEALAGRNRDGLDDAARRALFAEARALRRRIAFRNPLLNFDRIVFLTHGKIVRGERHMVDQYLGFNARRGGGVRVLEGAFTGNPTVKRPLEGARVEGGRLGGREIEGKGSFMSLDLDYDGKTVYFAFTEGEHEVPKNASYENQQCWGPGEKRRGPKHYYFRPESTYHIFRARLDGTDLRQLTDGMWNEYDPCVLPNGRVAFVSERAGGGVRCGARPCPTATLYSILPDGGDMIRLSWHDTNEWHPSVDNDGMLVYTRWDYVDRDSDIAHHIWHSLPDGRNPRSYHGNYPKSRESRPWMEMSIRAIPGSRRYVAVSAPHHGEAYGSLVLIDISKEDDRACSQVLRLTPEVHFPESETAPGKPHGKGRHSPRAELYGNPWPLSEDYYLCVYDPGQRHYGIYLIDSFGNRELVYRDPDLACLDPIPLRARKRPPVLPTRTAQAKADRPAGAPAPATGTVVVTNIYESELPWPEGTVIKELRIVNVFPKSNVLQDSPNIGRAKQSLGRGVYGTVPVESDGSAHFTMPAGGGVYFQAIDEQGLAVHTMRSATYLHPGETLSCVGCHQGKARAPVSRKVAAPLALRRAPSTIKPEPTGSYPLTFPRLVQPVLDAKCVACHDKKENAKRAPSLHGDRFVKYGWSEAFATLQRYGWGMAGGNGAIRSNGRSYSVPGSDGARVSKLYKHLAKGHSKLKLTPEEMRRITLWIDCNTNFYAAYYDEAAQARGKVVRPRWGVPDWTDFEKLVR
ncbi:MAG: HzsA-related protein, partial [Planctomycetota bacterium]